MDLTLFRAEQRAAFATRSPLAHAVVPDEPVAPPVLPDYMAIAGRTLYTRHMLGSLEAERDKRRAAKWYT